MTIRAHALRCPPPLSDCPHCFGIHRRKSRILPPLLSRVRPNPHPRLMLSCRPLLLRHYRHLLYTPIAASPPPAATNISCVLPNFPSASSCSAACSFVPATVSFALPLRLLPHIFFCSAIASSAPLVPYFAKLKQHPN